MALARVGMISGINTGFASTVTTNSRTTAEGNLLIAVVEADTVAQNGVTVTDSKSNIWSRVLSTSQAGIFDFEIWYTVIATGKAGASHTVTAADNGGGVDSLLIVEEWSGSAASPLDVSTSAIGISTALNSGNTTTTSQNNELIVGGGAAVLATLSVGAGYSNLNTIATTYTRLGFESKVVSTTGVQSAAMTAGSSVTWTCGVAAFKEAVSSTGLKTFMAMLGVGR